MMREVCCASGELHKRKYSRHTRFQRSRTGTFCLLVGTVDAAGIIIKRLYLLKLQHCPSLSKCVVGDQSCRRSSFGNSLFCSLSKNDSNSLSVWMYLTSPSLSFSLPPYLWCFKNSFVSLLPDINRLRAQMFSDTNTNRAWTRIHARLSKLLNKQAQRRNQSISTDRVTSSRAHNAVKIGEKKNSFVWHFLVHP